MTSSSDWFREWFDSPYYHKLYFERDEKEATLFIDRLLDFLRPPAFSSMLDVACGRGRHARILADRGYDTTGIDLSPANIAYARQFENERLHFYEHDMRRILSTHTFNYAFNFFTSFGYFRTERENSNALRTISLSLKNGGTLVLDYLNGQFAEDHRISHSLKEIDGVAYFLTKWADAGHFYKEIHIEDKKRQAPLDYVEKVARLSLDDFKKLFARHGLQMVQVFGDYELASYDFKKSPRLLMVAEKR
jgi:SAM-dependent methyltransferase